MRFISRTVIPLLIVPSFLFGCSINTSSKPLSPSETIIKFDQLAKKGDIQDSKQYIDPTVVKTIDSGKAWWIGTYSNFISEYDKKYKKVVPLKKTEKINGDMATVDVMVTYQDNSNEKDTYNLVKDHNQWKITMNQE